MHHLPYQFPFTSQNVSKYFIIIPDTTKEPLTSTKDELRFGSDTIYQH